MSKPWGDKQPTLEQFVEHYNDNMLKDEIVERANEHIGLDLNESDTKKELLAAVFESDSLDMWLDFDAEGAEADTKPLAPPEEIGLLPDEPTPAEGMTPGQREDLRLQAIEGIKANMKDLELQLGEARAFVEKGEAKLLDDIEKLRQLGGLPTPKTVPGYRLLCKRPKSFWCIGKELKPGEPLDVALGDLNISQRNEIETKVGASFITAEEIEVEVPDE